MSETVIEQGIVGEPPVGANRAVTDDHLTSMLVDRVRSEELQLTGEGGLCSS